MKPPDTDIRSSIIAENESEVSKKLPATLTLLLSTVTVEANPNNGKSPVAFQPPKLVKVEEIKPRLAVMRSSTLTEQESVVSMNDASTDMVSVSVPVLDNSVAKKPPVARHPVAASSVVLMNPPAICNEVECIVAERVGIGKVPEQFQITLYNIVPDVVVVIGMLPTSWLRRSSIITAFTDVVIGIAPTIAL
jgi:hypothetical protein